MSLPRIGWRRREAAETATQNSGKSCKNLRVLAGHRAVFEGDGGINFRVGGYALGWALGWGCGGARAVFWAESLGNLLG